MLSTLQEKKCVNDIINNWYSNSNVYLSMQSILMLAWVVTGERMKLVIVK